MSEIGIIREQGDLGLGFDILTEEEQEKIEKNKKEKENEDK